MMRLLMPFLLGLLAACGSAPDGDNTQIKQDSVINTEVGATTSVNTLTDAEKAEGWQLLFDGNSKTGWHSYLKKSDAGAWKVEDSTLFLDAVAEGGNGGGDLVTDEEYENFHLTIDWKISKNGNSGVLFSVKESPEFTNTYFTGPEMQVLDNNGHPDAKIIKHRAGDLYDLITSSSETVKPFGEWNTAEIVKKDATLELRLNGASVVKTSLWDASWKKLVAGSKFAQWSAFGTFKNGHIALQDHGNQVWYRNIKIRKL